MKTKFFYSLVVAVMTALVISCVGPASDEPRHTQNPAGPAGNSDAELEDLQFVATATGTTLQEATDRYGWHNHFARAVSDIRHTSPDQFAGAMITGDAQAWVAFAGQTPSAAQGIIDTFSTNFPSVSVEMRTHFGFTEKEIENAIVGAHYAVIESAGTLEVASSFDHDTSQINVILQLDGAPTDPVLDDLRSTAEAAVTAATREDILEVISVSVAVVRHDIGAEDTGNKHEGGEVLSGE